MAAAAPGRPAILCGPPRAVRLAAYAMAWLPAAAALLFAVPSLQPVYRVVAEKAKPPFLSRLVLTFADYDGLSYHLLLLLVVVGLLALDEAVVPLLSLWGRGASWAWGWFAV